MYGNNLVHRVGLRGCTRALVILRLHHYCYCGQHDVLLSDTIIFMVRYLLFLIRAYVCERCQSIDVGQNTAFEPRVQIDSKWTLPRLLSRKLHIFINQV